MKFIAFRAFFAYSLFSFINAFTVDEECLNYTVYPVLYEINLYPTIGESLSYYNGEIIISIIANAPVDVIDLDVRDLQIDSSSIRVYDRNRNIVNGARPMEYDSVTGKLHIYLQERLRVYREYHQLYKVKILFRKTVNYESSGIFLVKYYDEQDRQFKYLLSTRLSPNRAKYFFPCFDNPRFEAVFKFKVFLSKHRHEMLYANTTLVIAKEHRREQSTKNDYLVLEYVPSPQVGLYQVGFHLSQFDSIKTSADKTTDTLILWGPGHELHDFKFLLSYGISIVNLIVSYSKTNRPLVEGPINIVAVPAVISGYEIGGWNLLTNGAHKIVSNHELTSIKQIESMKFDLTQQLARIWLGNPGEIARTRWKEEWFKEGMATYFAYYFLTQNNYGHPTRQRLPISSYGLQMKHKAMAVDWHRSTPALETFNTSLAIEIPERYKELVTMKTGAILWMLENWVESDKFHQAVVNYINSKRGKSISVQDFVSTLDRSTIECMHQFFNGSTASKILGSWFSRSGYPVIQVTVLRDRMPNVVLLKQRRFSFTLEGRSDTDFLIPISYVMQNNRDCYNCYRPRFTIDSNAYTFVENLNGGWIILNRNGSGYYRVNYDTDTWGLIAKTLKDDMLSIDEMNRAQIVNDVFALYVAGDIDYYLALDILDYLDRENSPVVWEAVLSGYQLLMTDGAACNMSRYLYWDWESFLTSKVSPIFEQLIRVSDQRHLARLYRNNAIELACSMNYEPCHRYVRASHVENTRGKHNMFSDCRMSYFYVLANETFYNNYKKKLNAIELEDKLAAEKKIHNRNRFLMKIPVSYPGYHKPSPGSHRPMPIMESTTTHKPTNSPEVEKLHSGAQSSTKCYFTLISLCMLSLIIRNS